MKTADIVAFLGEKFTSKGNNSSLIQCVETKARASFFPKTIVNQHHHLYISLVMLLFISVVQNKALYGCQSLSNLSTTDINRLNISYNNGFKQMLSVPTSIPSCSVYLELGVIPNIYEI